MAVGFVRKLNTRTILIALFCVIYFIFEYYIAKHSDGRHYKHFTLQMAVLPILFFNCGRIASVLLNTIFVLILIFDFDISYNCQLVTSGTLDAVMGTNRHEAASMLSTICWPVLCAAMLVLGGVAALSWKLGRWNPRIALVSFVFILLSGTYACWRVYTLKSSLRSETWADIGELSDIASALRQRSPGVVGDVTYIKVMSVNRSLDKLFIVHPHAITDAQVIGRHAGRVHNIIFVMGESSLAKRYGVYGYASQNTTPGFRAAQAQGQVCVVGKVHSNANLTRYSVPMTFSFETPLARNQFFQEKNLIEMARDNGYKTFWISSQDGTGPYARSYGYISEYSDYTTRQDYNNKTNGVTWKDESLLPVLADRLRDSAPYKLYVLHINGSHQSYEDKVRPEDRAALPQADTYDQSIHHTDDLVQRVMAMAASTLGDYTLIYTSDHGEIVGVGHGYQYGGYDQYTIPMIIHDSHGTARYCDMAEALRNEDGYYTSIMNKYLLLDMLGYDVDPHYINSMRKSDTILHSDLKVYAYANLPTARDRH